MECKVLFYGIILVLVMYICFVLFSEKNFLWVSPVFIYLIFFVKREVRDGRVDLDERVSIKTNKKMSFDW